MEPTSDELTPLFHKISMQSVHLNLPRSYGNPNGTAAAEDSKDQSRHQVAHFDSVDGGEGGSNGDNGNTHAIERCPVAAINSAQTWRRFVSLFFALFLALAIITSTGQLVSRYLLADVQSATNDSYPDTNSLANGKWAHSFSKLNPMLLGVPDAERATWSTPRSMLLNSDEQQLEQQDESSEIAKRPLPTNSWCQNMFLGESGNHPNNRIYQIPYLIDVAGPIVGLRTLPTRIQADPNEVMVVTEPETGITLGAVESFDPLHKVVTPSDQISSRHICRLIMILRWNVMPDPTADNLTLNARPLTSSSMRAIVARGSPYSSVSYINATPRIFAQQQQLRSAPVIDGRDNYSSEYPLRCGNSSGSFSEVPVYVQRYMEVLLYPSDMTWIFIFPGPVHLVCAHVTKADDITSEGSYTEFRTVAPVTGVVQIALVSNCSSGSNSRYCEGGGSSLDSAFRDRLRFHSNISPSENSDINLQFPTNVSANSHESIPAGSFHLQFNWRPDTVNREMDVSPGKEMAADELSNGLFYSAELMTYALPHHVMHLAETDRHRVLSCGCTPTLHGLACPIVGNSWSVVHSLYKVSFFSSKKPRSEMIPDIREALLKDLDTSIPRNYMKGAGDTYFSGKLLARLARILIIADEVGEGSGRWFNSLEWPRLQNLFFARSQKPESSFTSALNQLRAGVEVWLNGSAISPFVYDPAWGGLVSCGSHYDSSADRFHLTYPYCPDLHSHDQNFGLGFYNDHHFHYGYHIYAAAVVSFFDHTWGAEHFERVLLYVRDIANPSSDDPYFTTWRHKDWFLGFSWASGIVTMANGLPFPNGRNQESASEAIHAYEAVALYGQVMHRIFNNESLSLLNFNKEKLAEVALRILDHGRVLMSLEISSAQIYFQVRARNESDTMPRIYPDIYDAKTIGMMWSTLAEGKTWFGHQQMYESYSIQLIPLTAISTCRDKIPWLREMLPAFNTSCEGFKEDCVNSGWVILLYSHLATLGDWKLAQKMVGTLSEDVFSSPGGNGHSRANTLWFIATR